MAITSCWILLFTGDPGAFWIIQFSGRLFTQTCTYKTGNTNILPTGILCCPLCHTTRAINNKDSFHAELDFLQWTFQKKWLWWPEDLLSCLRKLNHLQRILLQWPFWSSFQQPKTAEAGCYLNIKTAGIPPKIIYTFFQIIKHDPDLVISHIV
jgi:hypothetical protein